MLLTILSNCEFSLTWLDLNFFFFLLQQYLLHLYRSKVVTHLCTFCEKSVLMVFKERKIPPHVPCYISVNLKRNFASIDLLHQVSLWKVECADVVLTCRPWERSKCHILEIISFRGFQSKMHNKAHCPATNHPANTPTSPAAKSHGRPKCTGTSAGSSIPVGGVGETPLAGNVAQIGALALIQHWSALGRAMTTFLWKGRPSFQPLMPS